MRILKEVTRKLFQYIENFSAHTKPVAKQLGVAVFRKTRFNSHICFIRDSLRQKIIPNGFKLQHNSADLPPSFQRRNVRALGTCSRRLMKTSLSHFSNGMNIAAKDLLRAKEYLSENLDSSDYCHLLSKVRSLNTILYESLEATKKKKFQKLLPPPPAEPIVEEFVTLIPEDLSISEPAKRLLAKGTSFIPTENSGLDKIATSRDLDKFFRRVVLHSHFNNPNKGFTESPDIIDYDPFSKYKEKNSSWVPNDIPPAVSSFVSRCKEDVKNLNFKKKSFFRNTTKEEDQALSELKARDDIIIKRADKGGRVVVWSKELYLEEVQKQLSDGNFYRESEDRTSENNRKVEDAIVDEISHGNLPTSALNLVQKKPRCSRFYLLPKIHKSGNPGRPIVSACSCPTELVSSYLDDVLQPFVKNLPSYVKDSTDVLRKIHSLTLDSNDCQLFTMDVRSLYTVIPHFFLTLIKEMFQG